MPNSPTEEEPEVVAAGPSSKALGKRRAVSQSPTKSSSPAAGPAVKRLKQDPPVADDSFVAADSDEEVVLVSSSSKQSNLSSFYSVTCPICLGQPQNMVVTRKPHSLHH
jgi:hypothetical protein